MPAFGEGGFGEGGFGGIDPVMIVTAQPELGRMQIDLSGGMPGESLYVFRRDGSGTAVVRDTSDGSVTWGEIGEHIALYDYEAEQGSEVDYLLTSGDGQTVLTVRVTIPRWGTWLKSPGRPYLNARCYLESEGAVTYEANRIAVNVEGARRPVVLSQPRAAATAGAIRLVSLTDETTEALHRLLADGTTLLLDTDPAWGVTFTYVSVGAVTVTRGYFETLGLQLEARIFELADVLSVPAPVGVGAVEPGRTYELLPATLATYAAIPATYDTYEQLAVGNV